MKNRIQALKQQLLKAKKRKNRGNIRKERVAEATKNARIAAECALELRYAQTATRSSPTALRCFRGSLVANRESFALAEKLSLTESRRFENKTFRLTADR